MDTKGCLHVSFKFLRHGNQIWVQFSALRFVLLESTGTF